MLVGIPSSLRHSICTSVLWQAPGIAYLLVFTSLCTFSTSVWVEPCDLLFNQQNMAQVIGSQVYLTRLLSSVIWLQKIVTLILLADSLSVLLSLDERSCYVKEAHMAGSWGQPQANNRQETEASASPRPGTECLKHFWETFEEHMLEGLPCVMVRFRLDW